MHQSISHYAQTDRPHRYKYRNIRHLILIHFINFWARSISATWCTTKVTHARHTSHTTRHSTAWHTAHSGHTSRCSSTLCTIRGSNNWSPRFLNFLSLRLKFFSFRIWIRIDPINRFLHQILHFFLIIILNHILKLGIIQRIPHLIRHILQLILRLNRLPLLLIFRLIFLRIRHNFINLIFAQSSLIRINGKFSPNSFDSFYPSRSRSKCHWHPNQMSPQFAVRLVVPAVCPSTQIYPIDYCLSSIDALPRTLESTHPVDYPHTS